jgi:Protein of unknown function (DUF3489)
LVSLRPESRARPGSGSHSGAAPKPEVNVTEANTVNATKVTKSASKLDTLEKLLRRKNGATIADLTKSTGWQQHSVRGALAGAMKKRGHNITSDKVDGTRRYRIETGE